MPVRSTAGEYVDRAMSHAVYRKHSDGTFVGRIPDLKGVIAFGANRTECEQELRSVLEDWVRLGLERGDPVPVMHGIKFNSTTG